MHENKKTTSCEVLGKYIDELHKDYEIWYAKSVRKVMRIYFILQLLSLLSGFITSILTALTTEKDFDTYWRIVLIILPSVGSLAATILLQWRVYDLWHLREEGRIAFQDLVNEGRKRFAESQSEEECSANYDYLYKRASAIEREQKDRYFALTKSNFIANFNPHSPD